MPCIGYADHKTWEARAEERFQLILNCNTDRYVGLPTILKGTKNEHRRETCQKVFGYLRQLKVAGILEMAELEVVRGHFGRPHSDVKISRGRRWHEWVPGLPGPRVPEQAGRRCKQACPAGPPSEDRKTGCPKRHDISTMLVIGRDVKGLPSLPMVASAIMSQRAEQYVVRFISFGGTSESNHANFSPSLVLVWFSCHVVTSGVSTELNTNLVPVNMVIMLQPPPTTHPPTLRSFCHTRLPPAPKNIHNSIESNSMDPLLTVIDSIKSHLLWNTERLFHFRISTHERFGFCVC